MPNPKMPSILYLSSFPPRECGIATFTEDLTNAMDKEFGSQVKSRILAINNENSLDCSYPRKVIKKIHESEMEEYINRAYEINRSPDIKLVNIQHEYGLFGGEQGEYLLPFLELVQKPVIITMHTVLPRPDDKMKKIGHLIAEKSFGTVVMNKGAKEILVNKYGIKRSKIYVIPHGVHHIAFPSTKRTKERLGYSGHTLITTFGMISRDKGIEYAIEALPEVVKAHPDVLYLVIGATHPVVKREEGESYRNSLKRLVKKRKLENHVRFIDRYLSLPELIDYLKATDIYVYPMLSKEQASSGSLSYAMSCACPIIATASQYAKSVINHERGRLVKFKSSKEIEKNLLELLPDKKLIKEMKKNNYFYTRHMTWQNVALSYFKLFNQYAKIVPRDASLPPPIKLDYIRNLTDKFGMIQFANHTKPDLHSGYCADDNARALLGCVEHYEKRKHQSTLKLIDTYLNFLDFAQKSNGKFHNFVSYQKTFNDMNESEDSFGRAIWALGRTISSRRLPHSQKNHALRLLRNAYSNIPALGSLRAMAFTIIGLSYIAQNDEFKDAKKLIAEMADKLVDRFQATSSGQKNGWTWFENSLTYSNYKIPESLFLAYKVSGNKVYKQIAEKSMHFLMGVTFEKPEYFSPIGQDGWYYRNGKRAYFDQQPEDAASATEALVAAFEATDKKLYKDKAELAFRWFLGKNHLNQMVYDEATGGCYDGLGRFSINFNQGAESSLSYFLARLAIDKLDS
jgi:glycosyltransferase involved in cell wall biosynthesis